MQRRTFLRGAGAVGAAVVVGRWFHGTSYAEPFGEFPQRALGVMLPENRRVKRVLEVFLYGGLSQWETLYLVRNYGMPTDPMYANQQYYTFNHGQALTACMFPTGGEIGQPFATDALGAQVEIGPFARRLWQRPDVTARMRLVVQRHKLEPHEAAVPQALTGRPVGQPAAAGLGSHIQRFNLDRDTGERAAPFSYVFATGGISADNVSAAAATGVHPGAARPLLIKIDNADTFARLLGREEVRSAGPSEPYDALMRQYIDAYGRRLSWPGAAGPEPVRSRRFADLTIAAGTVAKADAIGGVLDPSLFNNLSGTACGQTRSRDIPGMSLRAARQLLTHPTQPAKYVCVSDIGLYEASGGGGYDTHDANSYDTARNFDNMLRSLLLSINVPGEGDPTKLDLDDTLIILNTEFGRTPWAQGGGDGRNHHPYGYVTVFIGGTITAAEKGVWGAIGPDGRAEDDAATPAENRIAALLAMGIWPFSPEAFAVSDVPGAGTEESAAELATLRVLGVQL
jgi:hypothetical protein